MDKRTAEQSRQISREQTAGSKEAQITRMIDELDRDILEYTRSPTTELCPGAKSVLAYARSLRERYRIITRL